MPVLPKTLFVLGARIQTARTARRLKRPSHAVPAQRTAFRQLNEKLAATVVGRTVGIEPAMTYESFRTRVPLRSYDQLLPFLERMKRGEADVLWPGRCALFAASPGTIAGRIKTLPVTDELLTHFRNASAAALLHYTARVGHAEVFRGRHLVLGSSSVLTPLPGSGSFAAHVGGMSGIAALNLSASAELHLHEPGAAIAQIPEWSARLDAIVNRTRALDITLLAGIPNWLLVLVESLRQAETRTGARPWTLQTIWPNLECIVHGGVPLAPFQDELRQTAGPKVNFHEIYAATEGVFAVQDAEPSAGLRLLSDAGLFFEFLPLRDFNPALPGAMGLKAVPLEGARAGEDYVLLITTPGGLCRYVTEDIVRFTSSEPPRLIHVGRTPLLLDAFGERVTEKDLTDSLVAVCQRHGWLITNFHVAPIVTSSLTGQNRGHQEWWIELKPRTIETPTGPILAGELDGELRERNPAYREKRRGGTLESPVVRLVMPGFFAHWMLQSGKVGDQHKMPRSRPDRTIADQLSAMACFNA